MIASINVLADGSMIGLRKAAVLMVALGVEASAAVLKHLTHEEVERITAEIAGLESVPPEIIQAVVDEFRHRVETGEFVERAGLEFARQVLDETVGTDKARAMVQRLGTRPFEGLRSVDPAQLAQVLQAEHPQTIALVISHLPSASGATVLSGLPAAIQPEVATRIATMEAAPPEVLRELEQAITARLSGSGARDAAPSGGAAALVEILNQVDRATERTILDELSASDPALADAIREQMFAFEDIVTLGDRTLQVILREVEQEDLRLALKGVGDDVRAVVLRNMSERAAETLKEDIELMGPVRLRDIEAAQKRIVSIIRRLEESGDVVTRQAGEDEIVV